MQAEIVLPETEPETEWVRGRARPKVSPTFDHSRVQCVLSSALLAWSPGHGVVGTEWRFRITPDREIRRPVVPDIAFVSHERMRGLTRDERQSPLFAPTVAIEILSPGDGSADVASKIADYLRCGSDLVVVVDPRVRSVRLHDAAGVRELRGGDALQHHGLPGFTLDIEAMFATALDVFEDDA